MEIHIKLIYFKTNIFVPSLAVGVLKLLFTSSVYVCAQFSMNRYHRTVRVTCKTISVSNLEQTMLE